MLDIERCRLLIKSNEFKKLNEVVEKEYIAIFDKFLKEKINDDLSKITFVDKVKRIIKIKPESETLMLAISNAYFNEEEEIYTNIDTLFSLYKTTLNMLID